MIHVKNFLMACAVTTCAAVLPLEVKADDWGCQVLLCLSGDWKGTPSCHPPINRLINAMKKPGFNWPICPQANGSEARYEPYKQCPSGFTSTGADGGGFGQVNDNGSGPPMCKAEVQSGGWSINGSTDYNSPQVTYKSGPLTLDDGTVVIVKETETNQLDDSFNRKITIYSFNQPMRERPYYIEYNDANGLRQRAWFTLN